MPWGIVTLVLLTFTGIAVGCGDSNSPLPGPPAALLVVSGDHQIDTVGHQLDEPLVVRVVDVGGDPVPGQIVNFVVTEGGGSVFAGTAETDSLGEARELWTLGTVAGDTQEVRIRAVDTGTGEGIVFGTFEAVGLPDRPDSI